MLESKSNQSNRVSKVQKEVHEIERVVQVTAGRSVAIDRKENEEINVIDRGKCVYIYIYLKNLIHLGPHVRTFQRAWKINNGIFYWCHTSSLYQTPNLGGSNTCLQPPWNWLTMAYSGQNPCPKFTASSDKVKRKRSSYNRWPERLDTFKIKTLRVPWNIARSLQLRSSYTSTSLRTSHFWWPIDLY